MYLTENEDIAPKGEVKHRNIGRLLKIPHIFTKLTIFILFLIIGSLFLTSKVQASGNHYSVVTDWYWICLGRAPDGGGLNYWVAQLNNNDNHNVVFSQFVGAAGCPQPTPRCTNFSASPAAVFNGESSTLSWGTQYGQYFGVSPNIGAITTASGSRSVTPTSTQTYTFLVTNPNGSATCTATVTVRYRFTNNRPNVPSRFSWSNGTYCGSSLLHDRVAWLSPSGNTSQESTTVSVGQNSVSALINLVGRVCTADDYSNADTNDGGRVKNRSVDGDAAYIRSATISSSPNIPGLTSTIQGKSVTISRAGQYSTRPGSAWTSISSSSFGIDGIGNLSPGTYNITINADVVYTSLLGGNRVCVGDQSPTPNVVGSNCSTRSTAFTISITVPTGPTNPPSPTCQMFGPDPSVIDIGDSARIGWTVTNAVGVQLTVNGTTTNVGHVVVGYTTSPSITTQYFITATDDEGERVTCSVILVVREPPVNPEDDTLRCDPTLYQSIVTGIDSYEMRRLNIQEQRYDPALGSSNQMSVNAIGYNIEDNYIYGIGVKEVGSVVGSTEKFLTRINKLGQPTRITVMAGMSNGFFTLSTNQVSVVGDFDKSGNLWVVVVPNLSVSAPSYVYKIDINYQGTGVARAFPVFTDSNPSSILRSIQDWTYINGSFYGVGISSGSPWLFRMPETAASISDAVSRGFVAPAPPGDSNYGAAWTNIDGRLYAGLNSGSIYEIEGYDISASSPAPKATLRLSNLGALAGNDGASCPNATDPLARVNYPYLRVKGSDVISGAVFADGAANSSCDSRRNSYTLNGQGSIKANGYRLHDYNQSNAVDGIRMGSSSAQYAVFALGEIPSGISRSSFVSNNGYYRGYNSGRVRDVAFANNLSPAPGKNTYGEYYNPGTTPCIDVANIEASLPTATTVDQSNIISQIQNGDGILKSTNDLMLPTSIDLGSDGRVVLYTTGKVIINGNIAGSSVSDGNGQFNGSQLTIIAKGGIEINALVSRIDANLIAHNSTLSTCNDTRLPRTNVCTQKLTVKGIVAGRKIEWRRNFGTIGTNEITLPASNGSRCAVGSQVEAANVATVDSYNIITPALDRCAAEFVNFDTSFYFANPFTLSDGEGIISGKPLNTTELPPLY